jgi:hypothetical protein
MSTSETIEDPVGHAPKHCVECGTPLPGGRFCPECGHPVDAEDAPTEELQPPTEPATTGEAPIEAANEPVPSDQAPGAPVGIQPGVAVPALAPTAGTAERPTRRGPRVALIAGVAAVVALLVGGAVAVLLTSTGSDPDLAYRQKVAGVFGPVLGANRQVSDELAALRGTHPAGARVAVRRAQQATTLAVGALGALTTPAGSQQLASDARQVLDREGAYLSAVGAVLASPSRTGASQLQTLSSNLTSALSAAGPTVAGTSQSVSGADRLAAWAPRAARTLQTRAKKKAARARKRAGRASNGSTGGVSGGSTAVSNPYANGRACGSGVYAGPNTSCEFAINVRDAYNEAPGSTASVSAFSPATGRTYTMDCSPSGSGVTCSGANNASVTFG